MSTLLDPIVFTWLLLIVYGVRDGWYGAPPKGFQSRENNRICSVDSDSNLICHADTEKLVEYAITCVYLLCDWWLIQWTIFGVIYPSSDYLWFQNFQKQYLSSYSRKYGAWASRINPTMNGGGCSVLIWGRTWITLLVDKGKPLSGDKGTRTDENGPKIRQGIMASVWTNIYAYEFGRSVFVRSVSSKWMILRKRRTRFVCLPSSHSF